MEQISPDTRAAIRNTYYNEYFYKTADNDTSRAGKIFNFTRKHWLKQLFAADLLGAGAVGTLLVAPALLVPAMIVFMASVITGAFVQIFAAGKIFDKIDAGIARDIDNGTLVERYAAKQAQDKQQKILSLETELSALQGKTAKPDFAGAAASQDATGPKTAAPIPAGPATTAPANP